MSTPALPPADEVQAVPLYFKRNDCSQNIALYRRAERGRTSATPKYLVTYSLRYCIGASIQQAKQAETRHALLLPSDMSRSLGYPAQLSAQQLTG